jgi:hypothetical protein
MPAVLRPEQLASFVEHGCCVLRGAFEERQAAAARRVVWRRLEAAGIHEADPSSWPPVHDLETLLPEPEVVECFTDTLAAAIEDLVEPGRWRGERRWGLWPVSFSYGADLPYDVPTTGWHIDGNWFRHTLTSGKQGLLVIGLFTDVGPRCGGTVLALGSHRRTARVLARHPDGIAHRDLFDEVLREPLGNFREVTGRAGDVVLAHPFLFHTRGIKHRGPPRIISNTEAPLWEPLDLDRPDPADHSVLEQSIRQALRAEPCVPRGTRMCRF